MFQDITTLLLNPVAYKDCCSLLEERYRGFGLDAIAGFEARGFFFGPPLALALGLPFVPLRKPKKLPGAPFSRRKCTPQPPPNPCLASGPTISESYALEYGTDALEMHVGAVTAGQRVLLVDDLVATGGTLCAGAALIRRAGAIPVEACCIIELPELGVRRLSDAGSVVAPGLTRLRVPSQQGRKRLGDLPCYTLIEVCACIAECATPQSLTPPLRRLRASEAQCAMRLLLRRPAACAALRLRCLLPRGSDTARHTARRASWSDASP